MTENPRREPLPKNAQSGEARAHAHWHRRVKYISKYIYQIGENKVKRRLRHIPWRMSLTSISGELLSMPTGDPA
jgi:hypothetical protein